MKMTIIFVFYCIVSFCVATPTPNSATPNQTENPIQFNTTISDPIMTDPTSRANHVHHLPSILPTKVCPTASPASTSAYNQLFQEEHLLMVAGGLILACTILLISTLLLAWKVCQLSRRLKMLSGHSDLMIPAKYWKDNNKSGADAKETAVLMGDLDQTRDEAGDGGSRPGAGSKREGKGEEVRENGAGQKENAAKNEEVKETPAAAAEEPSRPKEEGEESHEDKAETGPESGEEKDAKDGE